MAEFLLRYDGARCVWVSEPPGYEMRFNGDVNVFAANDGNLIKFIGELNGWQVEPAGKTLRFNGAVVRYESDDGTITAYFDGDRNVWVINGGAPVEPPILPPNRLLTEPGENLLTEKGYYILV